MDLNGLSEDQIKGLIGLLQNMLPKPESADTKDNIDKHVHIQKPLSKTDRISGDNKFDKMQEFFLHKEDAEIDKKLSKFPPVPRTRQFQPMSVICMVCGKQEQVSPNLVESIDRYKCNKCCSR